MENCKACKGIEHFAEVNKALEQLSNMKNVKISDDNLYKKRLSKCEACESLTINHVCMMCGCYIEIRAFVKTNKCPLNIWEY